MIGRRIRASIAAKLLVAQLLVIIAGSLTLALVALAIGPALFEGHVREVLGVVPDDTVSHLQRGFVEAVSVALAVAVLAAIATALGVSLFLARRIAISLRSLSRAATEIAGGRYPARAPAQGTDELAELGAAFNQMAAALESTEQRRRELLADVAHELRTPLATVEGYIEGLSDGVLEADRETLQTLRAEARRLGRLVEDLDKVSLAEERQLDLRVVRVEPDTLVEAAIVAARPAYAAKGVRLEAQVRHPLPKIAVDPDRMGEVFSNLLDNALRHTPPTGRVVIEASGDRDQVTISVTDSGEGIAPEHLERVLERFYRADRARTRADGGSGIGLAIARALADAHGGQLHAESDGLGRGARFIVTLPAAVGDLFSPRAARRG